MANNYTQTSFMIEKLTPPEETWLRRELEENDRKMIDEDDFENYIGINYNFEQRQGYVDLWLYADESFMVEPLVDLLQTFLKEYRPKSAISFTWSNTCSKMRLDEFSGGGVFITADDQQWFVPWGEIRKAEEAHAAKNKA